MVKLARTRRFVREVDSRIEKLNIYLSFLSLPLYGRNWDLRMLSLMFPMTEWVGYVALQVSSALAWTKFVREG